MRQVCRQDKQGLHQREAERCDHDQRELYFRAGQQHPGREHHDGGDDGENHRLGHHLRANDRGGQAGFAAFHAVVDVFPDDDGVIDDDTDHQEEGEQRQHVQRHAEHGQDQESTAKGDKDANRHPQGHDGAQEEEEDDQHQDATEQGGAGDRLHAAGIHLRIVPPQRQVDAIGQLGALAVDIVADFLRGVHDVNIRRGLDHDEHHRLAIIGRLKIEIAEAVGDPGDVADTQRAAIAGLADDDVLELGCRVGKLARGDVHVAEVGPHTAGGGIERAGAHGADNFVKGQVIATQCLF